ncbi:hypothetical protein LN650_29250 [Klebsiella pneumoniae subsp. pneumoniae]|nr:hypothetical protein [Klebsiella pneumoniae subsp. pneumoniae]
MAMQQIVAICRAIDLSAKGADPRRGPPPASIPGRWRCCSPLMRQLRDNGVSLIFVTHFLDQVYAVSDRITVLRNGTFVGCRETRRAAADWAGENDAGSRTGPQCPAAGGPYPAER